MFIILSYLIVNNIDFFFWYIGLPIFVICIIVFLIDLIIFKNIEYERKRKNDRLNRRLQVTGATRECKYCLKKFIVPSVQNSWDKYNRLDTIYCKRNHFDLEQIDDEMKRRAEEMKWRKDHTMICAWCDREFVDRYKSRYCGHDKCLSERTLHEKLKKGR